MIQSLWDWSEGQNEECRGELRELQISNQLCLALKMPQWQFREQTQLLERAKLAGREERGVLARRRTCVASQAIRAALCLAQDAKVFYVSSAYSLWLLVLGEA